MKGRSARITARTKNDRRYDSQNLLTISSNPDQQGMLDSHDDDAALLGQINDRLAPRGHGRARARFAEAVASVLREAVCGDVLWAVMFFQLFRLAFPCWSTGRTWLVTLLTTEAIESAQLLQAPWLVRIRETRVGGLLLGREFLVSDVICLAAGSCAAALVARWATHAEKSVTASSSPLRSRSAR